MQMQTMPLRDNVDVKVGRLPHLFIIGSAKKAAGISTPAERKRFTKILPPRSAEFSVRP